MCRKFLAGLIIGFFLFPGAVSGEGARPLALGGAFVGLADDGAAIFLNSAGLTALTGLTLTSLYTQPEEDVAFTSLGAAGPGLFDGIVGLGYSNLAVANVTASNETVSTSLQDITLLFSKKLRDNFSLGVDFRLISRGMSKDVAGFAGFFASGTALNAGIKYTPRDWLSLGLAVRNIGGKLTKRTGEEEGLNGSLVSGLSWLAGKNLIVNVDLNKDSNQPLSQLHFGLEWQPRASFALRLGADQTAKSAAENYTHLTAGFGLKYLDVTFDYAFKKWSDPAQSTSHYFSLGYGAEALPALAEVMALYPTPESAAQRKIKRVTFSDLPKEHWAREAVELLATAGLIMGFPDGTFHPNVKLTRQGFAILLAAAKHLTAETAAEPDSFMKRGEAAAALGLAGEITRPNSPLTRAEFAKMLFDSAVGQAAIKRLPELE